MLSAHLKVILTFQYYAFISFYLILILIQLMFF